MNKIKISIIAIVAVLFFILGCSDGGGGGGDDVKVLGNVIILQAYGNAGEGSPGGVSPSFVELYNISDKAVKLDGISLYYANGTRGENITEDEAWKSIALTGTIPANGSFLVLGAKHSDLSGTRYKIDDGYGDINNDNLSLNRRGFKAAIIKGSAQLTVQNPFDANKGKPVSGYIDMVGAVNNPEASNPDNIFGYETAPVRNSASVAVRRKDSVDTDNNLNDFIAARYGPTDGDNKTLSIEEFELRKPRNSTAGAWDPFADPPAPPDTSAVDYTKLKLNEISGVGDDADKFYELINLGDKDIPLSDCNIFYNANTSTGGMLPSGKGALTWTGSSSQKIEAGKLLTLIGRNTPGSFTTGLTAGRVLIITLEDPKGNVIDKCVRSRDTGDYAFTDKSFSRIPDGTGNFYFTTPTPNATNGTSTTGFTKFPDDPPVITGFGRDIQSVTPADAVIVSATVTTTTSTISSVVLQWTLNGTAQSNINMTKSGNVYSAEIPAQAVDSVITYKVSAANNLSETSISATQNYTVVSSEEEIINLLIFQVGASTDGAVSHNFVELYNAGSTAVSLTGYSLQYAAGTATSASEDGEWNVIELEGTIPSHCSFLVLGTAATVTPTIGTTSSTTQYIIPTGSGDMNKTFSISNSVFKVALMSNTTKLTVQNPFNTDGSGTKAAGYVDMVGALNTGGQTIRGYETTACAKMSKQQTVRRISLIDTDVNNTDFENLDYRGNAAAIGFKIPQNKSYGAWNPVSGVKE